jgi:hypothetical protein
VAQAGWLGAATSSVRERFLAGNALLTLCFQHAENAVLVGRSVAIEAAVANILTEAAPPQDDGTDEEVPDPEAEDEQLAEDDAEQDWGPGETHRWRGSLLCLERNDSDLVRQVSAGMLGNVAAFAVSTHVRLLQCGAPRAAIAVLRSLMSLQVSSSLQPATVWPAVALRCKQSC